MQRKISALPGLDNALTPLETEARHSSKPEDPTDDSERRRVLTDPS
jgi:hypothetical protein